MLEKKGGLQLRRFSNRKTLRKGTKKTQGEEKIKERGERITNRGGEEQEGKQVLLNKKGASFRRTEAY